MEFALFQYPRFDKHFTINFVGSILLSILMFYRNFQSLKINLRKLRPTNIHCFFLFFCHSSCGFLSSVSNFELWVDKMVSENKIKLKPYRISASCSNMLQEIVTSAKASTFAIWYAFHNKCVGSKINLRILGPIFLILIVLILSVTLNFGV